MSETTFPMTPPTTENTTTHRVSFHGTGSEYFRIWIVNLLLCIVTLGIYSAWAKVRRTRYFYGSTRIANSTFEYHGNPIAILKGRVVAFVLIAFYNLAFNLSPPLGVGIAVVAMGIMPWLIWKSLQFKLYNSSYRGIRFGFRGTQKDAVRVYLAWPLTMLFSFGLTAPVVHQRMKQFQHTESRFGGTHFSFHGTVGRFYIAYLTVFGIWIAGIIAILSLFGTGMMFTKFTELQSEEAKQAAFASFFLLVLAMYAWMFLLFPIFVTLLQNLIWNNTRLGKHQFICKMSWVRVAFIAITNVIGVACTLGLFMPFAKIRMLKYRVESMTLVAVGDLDDFVADTQAQAPAVSEGMADLLDFDLSL